MNTTKYKSHSIYTEHVNQAKKMDMSMNEYITHLRSLAEQGRTLAQDEQLARLQSLEGTVSSLVEALKLQKFSTDIQSRKIDEQAKLVQDLIEMQNKLLVAFGADVAFIQELKKEITQ